MNVPRWKPTWWRRAQLLWIVPTIIVIYVPMAIYWGVKEVGNPLGGLAEIWRGRK